jgi:hypothetical protein
MDLVRTGRALLALAWLGGCATTGTGQGTLAETGKPEGAGDVAFEWRSGADTTRGTIAATLPDGRTFEGQFVQLVEDVQPEDLGQYWSDLGAPGVRWGSGYGFEPPTTVRERTQRVVAQLQGPGGTRMRCQFDLAAPDRGPASGGFGACDLSTGETIERATLSGED